MDAHFVDEHKDAVRLGDLVASHPAIVVPAYFECSNLCGVVLRGVAASLAAAGLRPGRDVEVVAVSIAPLETPADALAKKKTIAGANDGWHFLTGDDADIGRFTDALGYRYAYVPGERQYAHASGIAIVSPGGRIARVLYGATFAPAELRDALASARGAAPPLAAPLEAEPRTWLMCFHYDPRTGRYSFVADERSACGGTRRPARARRLYRAMRESGSDCDELARHAGPSLNDRATRRSSPVRRRRRHGGCHARHLRHDDRLRNPLSRRLDDAARPRRCRRTGARAPPRRTRLDLDAAAVVPWRLRVGRAPVPSACPGARRGDGSLCRRQAVDVEAAASPTGSARSTNCICRRVSRSSS